eukprot:GHVR01130790.1.p1 GENE.GHVR01130790.1~~GHVR01130790.1.p1  ORF type:complete len:568 (+),score=88.33 GHVR01130790.1:1144-2847(+)
MADIFDLVDRDPEEKQQIMSGNRVAEPKDIFDVAQPVNKDSTIKSWLRTLYQIPSGLMKKFSYPLDLMQMMGIGAAMDPEEIDQIRKVSERAGIPFDEDKYMQAVQNAAASFPTQGNIEGFIEEKTGAPLSAQTKGQKMVGLASTAGGFAPGSVTQKIAAGVTAPAIATGLEDVGVPETLAEMAALGVSGAAARITPASTVKLVAKKPSGLPKRRFEKITDPTEISASKFEQINEKLEGDFRKISDEILSESRISKTLTTLEENPAFKSEVADQFRKVEALAEDFTERISTDDVMQKLLKKSQETRGKGFTPSEYDKDFKKFIENYAKETPPATITASDLVSQYRQNNKSLSEAYDPGKPYAFNRAKKDSLLEYNRAIAEVIEEQYPKTEFSKLFKDTNKQWSAISDGESINKFIDGMFDGKVQFKKGRKFFENENIARPFKRALGPNFPKFETLMKDMLSYEQPAKMLKIAKQKGFSDLAKTAGAYIIHPTVGKAKLSYDVSKNTYKSLMNSFIDKPQLLNVWEKGVIQLKAGKFSEAEKTFNKLKDSLVVTSKAEKEVSDDHTPE